VRPAGSGASRSATPAESGRRPGAGGFAELVAARYGPLAGKVLAGLRYGVSGAGQSSRSARSWETVTKR
jgi:hypothetical protein